MSLLWLVLFLAVVSVLAHNRASLSVWSISGATFLVLLSVLSQTHVALLTLYWLLFAVAATVFNVKSIRQNMFTKKLLALYKKVMPTMSSTEREALEAGTVSWEAEIFSGKPDWDKLSIMPEPTLSEEEQNFLDNEVEELCSMIDDWDVTHNRLDLPPEVWTYLKEKGFFAFIIPKRYGGKEFSALANSEILMKLAGRSVVVSSTVAVPNSLGPAELLHEYGTQQQKDYYLPRLASGEEVPCFALTGPEAGSDAASMPDHGVVCEQMHNGEKTLGIRLNFSKRYITLAPVATVIGLAFKLFDPDRLLGDKTELGITCALIPRDTAGIKIGRRHFPLNIPFQNGPIQGKNVFIPVDNIIGGANMAGQGWRMLMECLAAGRAISLPSSAVGGGRVAALATGAYARIRKQFNMPIGKFEGIEEALARIAGYTYLSEAARVFTAGIVDLGGKPSVPSAIIKYHATNLGRQIANDAMDVHGGKGICMGPSNYLARGWQSVPISITVEGANILTRSLIVFGQGAMRCHPYVFEEFEAALDSNQSSSLERFDKALFGHIGFVISNFFRAFNLGISHSYFAKTPGSKVTKRYYQHIARFSAAFALMSDMSMMVLGGDLKRREKLSARLGDILSMLYLASATIKRFEEQGEPKAQAPLLNWVCQYTLYEAQLQLDGVLKNFPNKLLAKVMRCVTMPLGRCLSAPSDKLGHQVATALINPGEVRDYFAKNVFTAQVDNNQLGLLEKAFELVLATEEIEKRVRKAYKEGTISGYTFSEQISSAVTINLITEQEAGQLRVADKARSEIIAVDDFSAEDLLAILQKSEVVKQQPAKSAERATG